ncbi:MAG: helix-turn-helix transcriptional regulator [candidate division Zixibacteria bacterium]|nr:helix-turn-helix transcriptional regulator [Candidatus Tariuqbacter arcticus]
MSNPIFGKLLKSLRAECGLSLRKFCEISELDPGNVSRWERGVANPPQTDKTLERIALILKLTPGSDQYKDFFVAASISSGKLPRSVIEDKVLLDKLPVLLRTLDGQKLSSAQLDSLIQKVRDEL